MIETKKNSVIAIILLAIPVFMISLFFLYSAGYTVQIIIPIIILVLLYVFMRKFRLKNRKKARVFTFLVLFWMFGIIYFTNMHFYNLSYPVMYQAFDEESYEMAREHFWDSESIYFGFNGEEDSYQRGLLIDPEGGNNAYIYQLDKEIYESEIEINTNGMPVKDIFLYQEEPYFTIIEPVGLDNSKTVIYKLDANDGTYEMVYEFTGYYQVYGGIGEIILTKKHNTKIETDIIIFDGNTETHLTVDYRIENMHNIGPDWFFFGELDTPFYVAAIVRDLDFDHFQVIIDDIDNVTFQTGFEHLVINGEGGYVLYDLFSEEITYFEFPIHFNGDNLYITYDRIYDINLDVVGEMLYLDPEGYVYGENRVYVTSNIDRSIVFNNEEMVEIVARGVNPGIIIPSYYKHVFTVLSLISAGFLIPYGFRREPLLFRKERLYQVEKNICPKCKSYNNYITFPDTCDYCGNTDFKQNTT